MTDNICLFWRHLDRRLAQEGFYSSHEEDYLFAVARDYWSRDCDLTVTTRLCGDIVALTAKTHDLSRQKTRRCGVSMARRWRAGQPESWSSFFDRAACCLVEYWKKQECAVARKKKG